MTTISISKGPEGQITLVNILLFCGIVSSLLYVAMSIIVALLLPGYSSASQTISELSAIDTPTRPLWVLLGIVYTLFVAGFGLGVIKSADQNKPLRFSGILVMIYGIIGLGWPLAPMHQREILASGGGTISDTMHIVFSAVSVLLMLLAIGFGALSFGRQFRLYSIVTISALIILGILTAKDAPTMQRNLSTPLIGVWERIMIGLYLLWIVVLAAFVIRKNRNQKIKSS